MRTKKSVISIIFYIVSFLYSPTTMLITKTSPPLMIFPTILIYYYFYLGKAIVIHLCMQRKTFMYSLSIIISCTHTQSLLSLEPEVIVTFKEYNQRITRRIAKRTHNQSSMTQGTKKWSVKFCCALSGTNTHTNNNNNEAKFITRGMPSICTVIIVIFFFFIHSLIFFHFCKLAIKVSNLINHVTKQREYSYGMEEAFVRYRYNDLDTQKK